MSFVQIEQSEDGCCLAGFPAVLTGKRKSGNPCRAEPSIAYAEDYADTLRWGYVKGFF